MAKHPHAEATYLVSELADGSFGVLVSVPEVADTLVHGFATRDQADAWLARKRATVDAEVAAGRGFSKPRGRW